MCFYDFFFFFFLRVKPATVMSWFSDFRMPEFISCSQRNRRPVMTSGIKIFASESLLTLPTDFLACLVEYYQELCQSLPLGCIFHQMPSWQSARRLNVSLLTQPLLPAMGSSRRSGESPSREQGALCRAAYGSWASASALPVSMFIVV